MGNQRGGQGELSSSCHARIRGEFFFSSCARSHHREAIHRSAREWCGRQKIQRTGWKVRLFARVNCRRARDFPVPRRMRPSLRGRVAGRSVLARMRIVPALGRAGRVNILDGSGFARAVRARKRRTVRPRREIEMVDGAKFSEVPRQVAGFDGWIMVSWYGEQTRRHWPARNPKRERFRTDIEDHAGQAGGLEPRLRT